MEHGPEELARWATADAERQEPTTPKQDGLTSWVVGIVLLALLGAAGLAVSRVVKNVDETLPAAITSTNLRVNTIEQQYAALLAANSSEHRAMMESLARIEADLKEHSRQDRRYRASRE
jgi:hypothetical protein